MVIYHPIYQKTTINIPAVVPAKIVEAIYISFTLYAWNKDTQQTIPASLLQYGKYC
jgi:hypothetical protein